MTDQRPDAGADGGDLERRAERWPELAEANGFRCRICGKTPRFEERAAFFETGLCGFHAHVAGKRGASAVDDAAPGAKDPAPAKDAPVQRIV